MQGSTEKPAEIVAALGGISIRAFKEHVTTQIVGKLTPIRERYKDAIAKPL